MQGKEATVVDFRGQLLKCCSSPKMLSYICGTHNLVKTFAGGSVG